ncbi:hypothetical protein FKP32DRAFT_1592727 [Trametes sanguinea]|nr:hypothetical protein FKP32DRAFT_1592727 [Trametes sanguinea]
MSDTTSGKIPLPAFLKMLTNHNIPPTKAMAVAGKIYKTHNTPQQLSMLTDFSLESAGVAEKELRKQVLAAVRKAGYKGKNSSSAAGPSKSAASSSSSAAKPSATKVDSKPQRKRKRDDDLNEFLPSRPREEADVHGSLEFNEILDEEVIKTKYTVVNRAPIMMAWAFIVAERLGFGREEALSIASVYTEMNAVTKGVSLGIYKDGEQRGKEASRTGSQPYVELMGRRPLYQTASSQWHALSSGKPAPPAAAFSYIARALRQTAPHIVGALRLLAASYPPAELNEKSFSLYAEFRPASEGWGQKGEVRCSTILALRKPRGESPAHTDTASIDRLVKLEPEEPNVPSGDAPQADEPAAKKAKLEPKSEPQGMDEYDAALDDDALFNDFDLSSIP